MKEEIIALAEADGFQLDDDEGCLLFSTRANGDIGRERASGIDIDQAYTLKNKIKNRFPDVKVDIETCDEWVIVDVSWEE